MSRHLLIIVLLFMNIYANGQNRQSSQLTEKQYTLIYKKAEDLPNKSQLSIAIINNGETKFFGIKRENDSTLTIKNADFVFEIGSITKVFTSTLLANFVIDQQLNLDDDINDYLNFPLNDDVAVSFQELATHTSGLPRIPVSLTTVSLDNPYKNYGEEKLKTYLTEKLEVIYSTGEKSEYSNLGFAILGYVLGKIADDTYEEMLQSNIFSKYKMVNSTTYRKNIEHKLIKGLNDEGKELSNWDLSAFMAAGGILSTVKDLSKFTLAQFDDTNKELVLTRTSFFKVTDSYSMGLGWGLIKTESGAIWNWHNGGTGGYTSSMIIDTKAKNGVIILSNVSALGKLTNNISSLCPELMNTLN